MRSHRAEPLLHDVATPSAEAGKAEPDVSDRFGEHRAGYSPFDIFQWLSGEAREAFVRVARRRHFPDGSRI